MNESLSLADYESAAQLTDQHRIQDPNSRFPLLGLFGETGSVLSEVKKKQRDQEAYLDYRQNLREEFGDVLWYLVAVAAHADLSLDELGTSLIQDLKVRQALTFAEIEALAPTSVTTSLPTIEESSIQLAAEVGLFMADFQAACFERNRPRLEDRLSQVFRALRDAVHDADLSFEEVARSNLAKINDRWPSERVYPSPFDSDFPKHEQFPRQLNITIKELKHDGKICAQISRNGSPIGDPLTDNRADDDDYRFHDVFHLAYAAHLGWSPTLRRLLKLKRKSNPVTDEVEDGARAILIEEGIAAWVFNHAKRLKLFEKSDYLDYGLLKSVRQFVQGYEVERCPLWLWEEAILDGFKVFRAVCTHRGGQVDLDLNERALSFSAP